MERHQKTLLSDEFGVGFAALAMEQLLGATNSVDVQFALAEPADYFNVTPAPGTRRTPDYLMWAPGGQIYVVECKGCQTSRSAALTQLRRGMEQVPTINIPGTPIPQLVIATHLDRTRTTVHILDPPDDELKGMRPSKDVIKRAPRKYDIPNAAELRTKMRRGVNLQHLRWISQHDAAARMEARAGFRVADRPTELPNAELTTVETNAGVYVGVGVPLAPEFGFNGPVLFRGIERTHFTHLIEGELDAESKTNLLEPVDSTVSLGSDGTCLLIENLPEG